jgi:hypothetical protein
MNRDACRTGIKKCLLLVFSLAIAYLLMECFAMRLLLPLFPLRAWGSLPAQLLPLAQYSKSGTIPKSYIMILGDSYATGLGDWYLNANKNGRPSFQSSHIIHQQLGMDVISLGQSGYGSLHAMVSQPVSTFEPLQSLLFLRLPAPDWVLVYFYEGNDLNDNLCHIRTQFAPSFSLQNIYDRDYFGKFIDANVAVHPPRARFSDNFLFFRALRDVLKNSHPARQKQYTHRENGSINRVLINGHESAIPDKLQSPALELTGDELHLSLYVFERALDFLSAYFPKARIGVVYIPSPLSSYRLVSPTVSIQTYEDRGETYPAESVRQRSDFICLRIGEIAGQHKAVFIDSRPSIWARSKDRFVHGPVDWKHFNQQGYTALAEAVIAGIKEEYRTRKGKP